jgi:hypothetical protein
MQHQRVTQSVVWLLIAVHLVAVYGCSTTTHLTLRGNEVPVGTNFVIAAVILKDGEIIEFDGNRGMYVDKVKDGKSYRAIVGSKNSKDIEIDPEKVLEVRFEQSKSNSTGTFFAGFFFGMPVGVLVFYLILTASFSSH